MGNIAISMFNDGESLCPRFYVMGRFLNHLFFVYVTIYILQVHSLSISSSMCVVRDGEYKKRVAIKRGFVAHHNLMGQ